MRKLLGLLGLVALLTGCDRFVVKTQVDTKLDMPAPVSTSAGNVRPVIVQNGTGRVALIDVDGLLLNSPFVGPLSVGENPVALFREKLEAVACDQCVRAVVIRVNSHGGGVAACIAMREDLERFKERKKVPVVACLMDTAAGGAYYLASGADYIVAGPATITGGVGVILNLFNLRNLMEQFNVLPQPIKVGELTDIGTSARKLTAEERWLLQTMGTEYHKRMIVDIKRSRPKILAEFEYETGPGALGLLAVPLVGGDYTARGHTFDGRIFTGSQAQRLGLVDQVGSLDDAIQVAGNMGTGTAQMRPQVVMYRRANDPARSIYAITANIPLQGAGLLPNLPGLDRSKLPTFLTLWQPELTMEKLQGK